AGRTGWPRRAEHRGVTSETAELGRECPHLGKQCIQRGDRDLHRLRGIGEQVALRTYKHVTCNETNYPPFAAGAPARNERTACLRLVVPIRSSFRVPSVARRSWIAGNSCSGVAY